MAKNNKVPKPIVVEGSLPTECVAAFVYTTFPTKESAIAVGRTLVEARLAGCINILEGMTSIYVWDGVTAVEDEVVLLAKVPADAVAACMSAIEAAHPYETPALLVVPVHAGSPDYLAWLRAGVKAAVETGGNKNG